MLSLPWGLSPAGGEEQPRDVQLDQDPIPEGQEAVTHSTTHQPNPAHRSGAATRSQNCESRHYEDKQHLCCERVSAP